MKKKFRKSKKIGRLKSSVRKSKLDLSWLRDHWSQMVVFFVGLLTAACYFIGRAKLLGWYDAAGVPILLFNWAAQDLVIRGLADHGTWILAVTVGILGVMGFAASNAIAEWLHGRLKQVEHRAKKFLKWLRRKESFDQLGLRKRWAYRVRDLRRQKSPDAKLAAEHWRVLGPRGREYPVNIKSMPAPTRKIKIPLDLVVGLLVILLLIVGLFVYLLIVFFYDSAYRQGRKDFILEYIAATDHLPEVRAPKDWRERSINFEITEQIKLEGRSRLKEYAYVQVTGLKNASDSQATICGWLIQGAGSQLLLLNREDLRMVTFADSPFQWRSVSPDKCE